MSLDHQPSHDELEALLTTALRAETPAGLSDTQRAALLIASQAQQADRSRWRRVLLLAIACALPCVLYLGVAVPRAREEARLQAAHAQQVARAAQLAAEAERAKRRLEIEQLRQREEAVRTERAAAAACEREPSSRPVEAGTRERARAAKASRPAVKASGAGGCEPNDPLCGL